MRQWNSFAQRRDGRGVITALAGLSKGCAAWVGVTALADLELGKRRATPPFLPSGNWDEHHVMPGVELVNGGGSYETAV